MFGTNPLRGKEVSDGTELAVQEIFRTIQGEGPDAGTPATFIRLWGCHLRCWFCDTDFESNEQRRDIEGIAREVQQGPRLIVLTGGEPMRQNIVPLMKLLTRRGHRVQIETAGSLDFQEEIRPEAISPHLWSLVVSPKTHVVTEFNKLHAEGFKYVISARLLNSEDDGLPIVNYQSKDGVVRKLARPPWLLNMPERIFVQPMDENDLTLNKANQNRCVDLALRFGYRLSLQQHKIIGVP